MNKKILKNIILFAVLIVGAITAAIGISMGAKNDYKKMLNMTDIYAMVPADGIVSLNIDVNCADLEITASNDVSGFEISANHIPRNYLKYTVSNNILNLKYSFNKWYEVSSVPILLKDKGKIKITVPADAPLQDIQIESGMNDSDISYLTAENIYLNCGSGDNVLNDINTKCIELYNGSGDTTAKNLNTDKLIFSGGRGKTDISNFQANKASFKTGSGDVSVIGNISGNSDIQSGIGDINAKIVGNAENYSVNVLKGKINVNGKEVSNTGNETDKKYKMDVSAGMGDVNISFNYK